MLQGSFEEKMLHVEDLAYHQRMAEMTLPKRGVCEVDDKTALMDQEYFDRGGESHYRGDHKRPHSQGN